MSRRSTNHPLPWRKRLALTRRLGRRLAGAAFRGRWWHHPHPDDRRNLRRLWLARTGEKAECPLCGYRGTFFHHAARPRQICPDCGSRSRHRVFQLAFAQWRRDHSIDRFQNVLHLAPESCLEPLFENISVHRITGDLDPTGVHLAFDLCRLPFADHSFDLVFASHVLEHIVDDRKAIAECFRVLRPGGLAILMVPVTEPQTVDYGFADEQLNDHARECGLDYFERYSQAGFQVEVKTGRQVGDVNRQALETWEGGEPFEHHIPFCFKPTESQSALR